MYKITEQDDKTVITLTTDTISTEKEKEHSTENWQMVLNKVKQAVEINGEKYSLTYRLPFPNL
jgi:hypothetical protein